MDRLQRLQDETLGAQAVRNLYAEERLSDANWLALIAALVAQPSMDVGAIKLCVIHAMRHIWNMTPFPGGIALGVPTKIPYGRASSSEAFARLVSRSPGGTSASTLLKALRRQMLYDLKALKAQWKGRPLGLFPMWATFELGSADPFRHSHTFATADDVRACLGLPPETGPVVSFIYELPAAVSPHYPTIIEAYAADSWNYYFMPSNTNLAGKTLPWNRTPALDTHHEVVHQVVTADQLVTVPKEIW
ncbi:MAG: hypothetical protein JO093_09635 [Acidobacteria bacterium]|nr:hypothetical protein [Acidobacteriota bacterium]